MINDILFALHLIEQCMDENFHYVKIMWKKIENLIIKTHWENGAIEVFFLFHLDISSIVEYKNLKCP